MKKIMWVNLTQKVTFKVKSFFYVVMLLSSFDGYACTPPNYGVNGYSQDDEIKKAYESSGLIFVGRVLSIKLVKTQLGDYEYPSDEEIVFKIERVIKGVVSTKENYKISTYLGNSCNRSIFALSFVPPPPKNSKVKQKQLTYEDMVRKTINTQWFVSVPRLGDPTGLSAFHEGGYSRESDGIYEEKIIAKFKLLDKENNLISK